MKMICKKLLFSTPVIFTFLMVSSSLKWSLTIQVTHSDVDKLKRLPGMIPATPTHARADDLTAHTAPGRGARVGGHGRVPGHRAPRRDGEARRAAARRSRARESRGRATRTGAGAADRIG